MWRARKSRATIYILKLKLSQKNWNITIVPHPNRELASQGNQCCSPIKTEICPSTETDGSKYLFPRADSAENYQKNSAGRVKIKKNWRKQNTGWPRVWSPGGQKYITIFFLQGPTAYTRIPRGSPEKALFLVRPGEGREEPLQQGTRPHLHLPALIPLQNKNLNWGGKEVSGHLRALVKTASEKDLI